MTSQIAANCARLIYARANDNSINNQTGQKKTIKALKILNLGNTSFYQRRPGHPAMAPPDHRV